MTRSFACIPRTCGGFLWWAAGRIGTKPAWTAKIGGGVRYGIRLEPTAEAWDSLRLALLRDESRPEGRKTRVNLSLYFVIGEGWEFARARDKESARMHFLPAERERRPFLREAR